MNLIADDDAVLDQGERWLAEGRGVALATVVATWGSSPRPVGSHLVVDQAGAFVGSVSGGCVESAVIAEALEAIVDGRPRTLEFGVSDEQAWEVGLACGGTVRVHVMALGRASDDADPFTTLQRLRHDRSAVALVVDLSSGRLAVAAAEGVAAGTLPPTVAAEADAALAEDASRTVEGPDGPMFVRCYGPPWSLVLVGAVHIAQALAPMAAMTDFAVTVIDPRPAFATAERFPGVDVRIGWPDVVLAERRLDRRTAVIALSHDPKVDDPALIAAVNSPAFFIGALGSRRTHARRRQRLASEGCAADQLDRIAGPVGLDLGARTPAEIAVSVLAEIVGARRGRRRQREAMP